jgi:hypothetical protein
VVVTGLGATVVVVVDVVVAVGVGVEVGVGVGVVVVAIGTVVVVGSVAGLGVGIVVALGSAVRVCAVTTCAVTLTTCVLAEVAFTSFFASCETTLTMRRSFVVVDVTLAVATTVVVEPGARVALGCTVAIGIANAIRSTALSERAIVLATTWWARMAAATKRRNVDGETLVRPSVGCPCVLFFMH